MTLLLATIVIGAIIGVVKAVPVEYYASRYDHLDVDTILNNRRMVNYYASCLLSRGPCPPQGIEFKRILPEALHTNCIRCTEKQKTVAYRSIKRLRKEYPKIWEQLSTMWDPDGSYIRKFEATFQTYDKRPSTDFTSPAEAIPSVIQITSAIPSIEIISATPFVEITPSVQSTLADPPVPISLAIPSVPITPESPPSQVLITSTEHPNNEITSNGQNVGLADRFGDSQESDSNTIIKGPYPASIPASSSTAITNKPLSTTTFTPLIVTKTTRAPPAFRPIGAGNLQATVSLVKAIKAIVMQLYQHKMATLNRILSGR